MIDPQALDFSLLHQSQYQLMRGLEHPRIFHAQRGQIMNIEETAVVDLIRRRLPMRQTISLLLQQPVQSVERLRLTRTAVIFSSGINQMLSDLQRLSA